MASPEEMAASMVANMKDKTGKTLPQWVTIARKSKLDKHGKLVAHLKADHGMTHGFANLVALTTLTKPADGDDLVATQYKGTKADLRPIYDALVKKIARLGKDVELSPKKAYVSLRRSKQFGLIQPSTRTRIDLGLNLKGVKPTRRLEAAGSFNSMVTHRVRLESAREVDAQLLGWIKQAYDLA